MSLVHFPSKDGDVHCKPVDREQHNVEGDNIETHAQDEDVELEQRVPDQAS